MPTEVWIKAAQFKSIFKKKKFRLWQHVIKMSNYDVWVLKMKGALHWHSPTGGSGAVWRIWQPTTCDTLWDAAIGFNCERAPARSRRLRGGKAAESRALHWRVTAGRRSRTAALSCRKTCKNEPCHLRRATRKPTRRFICRAPARRRLEFIHLRVMWFSPWLAHSINSLKISILFTKIIHLELALSPCGTTEKMMVDSPDLSAFTSWLINQS